MSFTSTVANREERLDATVAYGGGDEAASPLNAVKAASSGVPAVSIRQVFARRCKTKSARASC
jgi:hypothetical protein